MRRCTLILLLALIASALITACRMSGEPTYTVTIVAGGTTQVMVVNQEMTVNDVLRRAEVTLGDLDRVNPPGFTRISDGLTITVVRVEENILVVEEDVPFERRTTLNDGLPAGETRLLQAGVNGVAEITYRVTYEDGVETSRSEIRRVLISDPQDEIIMVGSQGELPNVTVNGTLAFISGGNAWIIRQNSANRRPLTLEGGVDGRVFALSSDGKRLLFTRTLPEEVTPSGAGLLTPTPEPDQPGPSFNTLWIILDTTDPDSEPLRLDIQNVLYAGWVPGAERTIIYSTAEPRASFPGWQANNDLWRAQISVNGVALRRELLLEPSSGGIYGWYGTTFAFAPDGATLAWAQPDAVGVLLPIVPEPEPDVTPSPTPATPVEPEDSGAVLPRGYERQTLATFPPHNAYDFVWVPSLSWSPDGALIATTVHGPPVGVESPEDSPVFNLTVFPYWGGYSVELVERAGMWALAQFSPGGAPDGAPLESVIAYLKAIDPLDSVIGRYRLAIVDRDGSNERVVFPAEGEPGLEPQVFAWSPDGRQIALIYQGNLYLLDAVTGLTQQISGDGLSSSPRWTP
jgi:hypothetical protein